MQASRSLGRRCWGFPVQANVAPPNGRGAAWLGAAWRGVAGQGKARVSPTYRRKTMKTLNINTGERL